MPNGEAMFSVTEKFKTIRGDSLEDFKYNVEGILGVGAFEQVAASFREAFGVSGEGQAIANLQAAGLISGTPQTASAVIGLAAAQQSHLTVVQQPQAATPDHRAAVAEATPPTVVYPGDCPHGTRSYKDSLARGKQWRRWECFLPWEKGNEAHNAQRCKPVNV